MRTTKKMHNRPLDYNPTPTTPREMYEAAYRNLRIRRMACDQYDSLRVKGVSLWEPAVQQKFWNAARMSRNVVHNQFSGWTSRSRAWAWSRGGRRVRDTRSQYEQAFHTYRLMDRYESEELAIRSARHSLDLIRRDIRFAALSSFATTREVRS